MPFCSKCNAGMVRKFDLEDHTPFWDCPNLCIGTKPLSKPWERKKKAKIKRSDPGIPPAVAPVLEIPLGESIDAIPRREAAYSTQPFSDRDDELAKIEQAEEVEAMTGNAGWRDPRRDTNMATAGGLPPGRMLKFWTGPTCDECDRPADTKPDGGWGKKCWIHGGPLVDRRPRFVMSPLVIRIVIAIVCAAAAAMLAWSLAG